MQERFANKVAIITGSTSGIGKATAVRMAREGAAVCIVANRNAEGGDLTVRQIRDAGGRALFVQADVGKVEDCQLIRDKTVEAFGRVDILVNNAGITRGCPLEEIEESFYSHVMDTNLKSAFFMSRAVIRDLLAARNASVTMVSSVHAQATRGRSSVYAATKAGMVGMTRSLAVEFGDRGVRFNCVLPGTIDIRQYPRDNAPVDQAAWKPRASDVQVMKRLGTPDEVAAVICFLSSDEASFCTGETWAVDGGLLCHLKDY